MGTSQAKIRSLVDEAELPGKLRVEGPNHRVPLGDGPILHKECERRRKPAARLSRKSPPPAGALALHSRPEHHVGNLASRLFFGLIERRERERTGSMWK
jgi:hypothetical protein